MGLRKQCHLHGDYAVYISQLEPMGGTVLHWSLLFRLFTMDGSLESILRELNSNLSGLLCKVALLVKIEFSLM